jgi:hypothetical protein
LVAEEEAEEEKEHDKLAAVNDDMDRALRVLKLPLLLAGSGGGSGGGDEEEVKGFKEGRNDGIRSK